MQCPLCQTMLSVADANGNMTCGNCQRTWYETGEPEYPLMSRPMRVRMVKLPEEGDMITDVLIPVEKPS